MGTASEKLQELFAEGRQVAADTVQSITGELASLTSKMTSEVQSEAHQVSLSVTGRIGSPWHRDVTSGSDEYCAISVRSSEAMLETV